MKYIALIAVLFSVKVSMGQQWHNANKKLKAPKTDDYYQTIGYFNWYDTVQCVYVLKGDSTERTGYKRIFSHQGDIIDNRKTFKVFYDDKMKRVYNVDKYYFK